VIPKYIKHPIDYKEYHSMMYYYFFLEIQRNQAKNVKNALSHELPNPTVIKNGQARSDPG